MMESKTTDKGVTALLLLAFLKHHGSSSGGPLIVVWSEVSPWGSVLVCMQ